VAASSAAKRVGTPWARSIRSTGNGKGIDELAGAIRQFEEHSKKANLALKRSIHNWQERLLEMLRDVMLEKAKAQFSPGRLSEYAQEVAEHKRDPYTLVEEIVGKLNKD